MMTTFRRRHVDMPMPRERTSVAAESDGMASKYAVRTHFLSSASLEGALSAMHGTPVQGLEELGPRSQGVLGL